MHNGRANKSQFRRYIERGSISNFMSSLRWHIIPYPEALCRKSLKILELLLECCSISSGIMDVGILPQGP